MAQQTIFLGTNPNDHTGETLRGGGSMINDMFTELYALQSQTINAGSVDYDFTGATDTQRIDLAIADALLRGFDVVYIPGFMLPYDVTLLANLTAFTASGGRLVREGGNFSAYEVLAYGAAGVALPNAPSVDSSAAIQTALNTGRAIDFCGLAYLANNLTQTANQQILYSSGGIGRIIKNANGDLLTSSGDTVRCLNLEFWGDAVSPVYTGNNVTASGNNFTMINCGSRRAYARAVKATGSHTQILGTCDIYQTADATASGYDIEIGVSGTATLYHELHGIYSSQATGGILLTDTGSHTLLGGEFGKLTIAAGTLPAGVNGGKTVGGRILGNVSIGISSALFSANQFGASVITFETGTSSCVIDITNTVQAGGSVVNNGSANNLYIRPGTASGAVKYPGNVQLANAKSLLLETAAGGTCSTISASASDNLAVTNSASGKSIQYSVTTGGLHQMVVNGVEVARFDGTATATQTRFMVYDVDNATLERVTVGAADSGGVGFKVLRIPN